MHAKWLLRIAASCAMFAAVAMNCVAQDVSQQIQKEILRLQTYAKAQKTDDEMWKQLKPGVDRYLAMADEALKSGRMLFALEEMGKANEYVVAHQFADQSPEVLKQGMAGFETVWKKSSVELTALDNQAKQRRWTSIPAAIRALSESRQGQGMVLLEASRAYATVTQPESGYFYLGQAKANEELAGYLYSLGLRSKGTAFVPRSILPEIQILQNRINAVFVPPRSIERHRDFIQLNSMLKVAGELDASKLYAGALYQYLQSLIQFELLDAKNVDAERKPAIREAIAAARKQVTEAGGDNSIAEMFVQRAETLIANKNGAEATPEEWANAAVVVDHVIPAYFTALKSPATAPAQEKNAVAVTLVRWPYT